MQGKAKGHKVLHALASSALCVACCAPCRRDAQLVLRRSSVIGGKRREEALRATSTMLGAHLRDVRLMFTGCARALGYWLSAERARLEARVCARVK